MEHAKKRDLIKILDNFSGKKIMVIGDVMLDEFTYGHVNRISPEAPVPVTTIEEETYKPGGSGNSANNIVSLGAEAYLVGVVGKNANQKEHLVRDDLVKAILLDELKKRKINVDGIVEEEGRKTTHKNRIISIEYGQQNHRLDNETLDKISKEIEYILRKYVYRIGSKMDGILISDYNKGLITKNLVDVVKKISGNYKTPLVANPKPDNANLYKEMTLITLNQKEAQETLGKKVSSIYEFGNKLAERLKTDVLITRGKEGMTLFKDGLSKDFPTRAREVYDVSGAGDTVASILTLALASGADIEIAVELANIAAGIVVGKRETATTTVEEMKTIINQN